MVIKAPVILQIIVPHLALAMRSMLAIIVLFFTTTVYSQVIVKGIVMQVDSTPLEGVNLISESGNKATTTDAYGRFELKIPHLPTDIKISHAGFESVLLHVKTDAELQVVLNYQSGTLDEVTVASKYLHRYANNSISSALRLKGPLINLSQNIQSITPDMIEDQGSYNLTESVTRNVSGVTRMESSNNLGPYMYMRGGQISSLRNGIDLTPLYRGPVPEDAAIIDRVEFIKGPSMFMNNIGDPAGSFNVVTKQPQEGDFYSFQAMVGSQDFYRLSADLNGAIGSKKKFLYRLNAMGMKSNSFVRFDHNNRLLIAPVLQYNLSPRTTISLEYMYQQFRYAMMSPIIMSPRGFGTLPSDFSIHEPSLPDYQPKDHSGFLTLTHQLNKNWSFTVRGAMMHNRNEGIYMWVTEVNSADSSLLLRNPKYDLTRTTVFSQQAFINGRFATAGIQHQFLSGLDVNQKNLKMDNYVSYDTYEDADGNSQLVYYPLSIDNPEYGAAVPSYTTPGGIANANTFSKTHYYSIYALDEFALFSNKLRITVGGRFTSINTSNTVSGNKTETHDQVLTPRVGLSYSILPAFTVYALLDRTVIPQSGVTVSGAAIEPLRGRNYEVGLKKNWRNGQWNTTLSLFNITREGIVSADPDNMGYQIQIGKTGAKGIDFDLAGQLVKGLNLVINYAYNDAKVEDDINPQLIGKPTGMFVKHIQNTWLNYEFGNYTPFFLRGFSLSLGYQYQGKRGERYATATPVAIPDYFRLDGGLGWQKKNMNISLVVNNILNKKLIGTPWYRSGLYYWVPQSPTMARLTVNYTLFN